MVTEYCLAPLRLVPIFFLTLLFLISPLLPHPLGFRYSIDAQRLIELFILLSFLPFVIFRHLSDDIYIPKKILIPLVILLLLGVLSSLLSPDSRSSFLEIGLFSCGFLILANSAHYFLPLQNRSCLIWISGIVVLTALINVIESLFIYTRCMMNASTETLTIFKLALGYSNPRFLNHVQVIGLCLFPLIIHDTQSSRLKKFFSLLASVWFALLLMTHGRGAFGSLIITAVLMHVLYQQKSIQWIKSLTLILVSGIVLYIILTEVIPHFTHHELIINYENFWKFGKKEERWSLWLECLTLIKKHPWLGIGPMQLVRSTYGIGGHPHNFILQTAAEMGVPFTVTMLLLAFQMFQYEWRSSQEAPTLTMRHISCMAALIASVIFSMVSGVFIHPMGQTWFFLVLGWSYANHKHLCRRPATSQSVRISRFLLIALIVASAYAVFQGVWPEIINIEKELNRYCAENPKSCTPVRSPRLWSVGQFNVR